MLQLYGFTEPKSLVHTRQKMEKVD